MNDQAFLRALESLLITHSHVPCSNTPREVLAAHMLHSLKLFESSLIERAAHPFYAPGRVDA